MKSSRKQRKHLISRLRLSQLELLAAMDRTETLSAAAREVNLTQPAASRLLRELSSDLRVVLFERIGRILQPTAAGRALIRRAVGFLADLDRTQDEIEAIDGGLIGTVRIGAGVSSCYVVVPTALKLLMDQSPQIAVSVREGAMDELVGRLRAGQIDLLVGRFGRDQDMSDLNTEDLYRPNVVAVCGVRHPLASRRSLQWNDLYEQPWIFPEAGTAMRSAVEFAFSQAKTPPHQGAGRVILHPGQCRAPQYIALRLGSVLRRGKVFRGLGCVAHLEGRAITGARCFRPGSAQWSYIVSHG